MVPKHLKQLLAATAAALAIAACSGESTPEPLAPPQAAIAMPDTYSANVASDILEAGGNAVDAAIATAFALAVTFPEAGNIGGGGFMLVHMNGSQEFIDYRETAPLAAHRDMYLDDKR